MKTVAFICQKGGTAKTTGAINLAVEALAYGLKVVLIDLDPQVSASNWFDLRDNPEPAVVAPQVPHLERVLAQAAENGADLAIIDTAGRTNDAALDSAPSASTFASRIVCRSDIQNAGLVDVEDEGTGDRGGGDGQLDVGGAAGDAAAAET